MKKFLSLALIANLVGLLFIPTQTYSMHIRPTFSKSLAPKKKPRTPEEERELWNKRNLLVKEMRDSMQRRCPTNFKSNPKINAAILCGLGIWGIYTLFFVK